MNELKKALLFISIGIIIGVAGIFFYQTRNNREDIGIAKTIAGLRESNDFLSRNNIFLIDKNRSATERVGILEKQIIDDNSANQERFRSIADGLSGVASGLSQSTITIRTIREGLEEIKRIIEMLPID